MIHWKKLGINMDYQGQAFHQQFEKGKKSGLIKTRRDGLSFHIDEEEKVIFSYGALKLERGGSADRLIYFKHSAYEEWILYTSEQDVLKDDYLLQNCPEQVQSLKKQKLKGKAILLTSLIIFILSLFGLWFLKAPLTHMAAEAIPVEVEVELGQKVFDLYSKQTKLLENEEIQKDLEAFTAELTDHIKDKPYPYKFHIVLDSTPNAAAFPGGNIIIHTGLFSLAEAPEEILGVLAHEIAHVNERHSLHSMLNTAGTLVLAQVFLGDIEILSGILLEGGIHLLLMKNSRDHETEADFEGFEYLQEAKINPKGLVSFFEKLDNWKPELIEEGEEVMSFMSTHPLSSERVAYLEEKISNNSLENYREIHFDLEAFKKKLEKIHQTKTEDKQEKE